MISLNIIIHMKMNNYIFNLIIWKILKNQLNLNITYKDTSDILEQSQKLELAILLAKNKNKVIIYERPFIIEILKNKYNDLFEYKEL